MMRHALLKASALLLGLPLVCISTSAFSFDARSSGPPGRAGVIQVAENEQCVYRCRIVREECADDSKRASRPDDACWTTYGQCRTACGEAPPPAEETETKTPPAAPAAPAAPARAPAERTLTPRIITVGKWAEGIGFDGTSLWVAESGQRTIAQVNVESGKVVRHVTVGRFPVGMTSAVDGSIYALLQTDKLIWLQSPGKASGRALASDLEGCPNGIARADDGVLWVLTWPACSSDSGKVIRLNPNGGGRTASKVFGEYGEGIAAFGGKAWVAHSRGPALTVVDEHMVVREGTVRGASLKPITSNSIGVYAGGSIGENTMQGLVVSINPNTLQEARRSAVNERIAAIAADDSNVVAMGVGGRIWVYSAERLVLQRTVRLSTGGFEPHALSIVGDRLFISKSEHQGENGAVLVLTGWR